MKSEIWDTVDLSEVIMLLTDYHSNGAYKKLKENVELLDKEDFALMIRTTNFEQNDFTKNNKYITEKAYNFLSKSKVFDDDLIMNKIANAGSIYYAPKLNRPISLAMNLFLIRINKEKANPKFIYYYLKVNEKYVKSFALGSVTNTITKEAVKNLKIILPPLVEQNAITQIIESFDNKIELLQDQNKTLEETAQTIFTEWFGKYSIDDEQTDGWRIFQLNELVDIINGYSYKGSELVEYSDEALVTLKSFDRNGGFQTRGFKPFRGKPKDNQEVKIGDLVVAHTDLTQDAEVLGNPAFIFDDGGFKKMYITMDLVKVISLHKDISSSFLYYLMKDKAFKGHCVGYSNGTTVLHLSKRAIPEYQLLLPTDFNLIKKFSEIANSTTTKISLNKITIKSLTQTRDELLPRLMSGEIRIKEFNV
ncbi:MULTISPECIES: restriction endonuclease subunit S [unclassified Flavobacterium]|uniref:restriction endonuclease subunit S n=1 Tax=unclassified Flavobacterium TaxID=196869 RepID=UPI00129188D4|nr:MULTISPECIES: restriction endonuclease subunit S [unclassified Flavobacterium]MQP52429.1 restriction endonuclease subunit S [Flavobacterium sp. LMO9]MQP62499.1 restriction endonuclease subunit S [Flavobacterium sp. LMO6]